MMPHLRLCPPVDTTHTTTTTAAATLLTLYVHGSRGQLVPYDPCAPSVVTVLETRRPHEHGQAQCTMCTFTWMAVAPVSRTAPLQCPQCRGPALFPLPED